MNMSAVWRRWAVIGAIGAALIAGGLVAAHTAGSGASGKPSASAPGGSGGTGLTAANGGNSSNGGNGNQIHGVGGAPGSSSGAGGGPNSAGGPGAHASPTPKGSPYVTPAPAGDQVFAKPDLNESTCPGGYPPNTTCKVYVQGLYQLISHPAGKLVVEVLIDGSVAYSQSYSAPGGGHQFGSLMQFSVPKGAKQVVYQAILDDVTGKTLAQSTPYVTYAS